MSIAIANSIGEAAPPARPGKPLERAGAVAEVVVVFALTHVAYRAVKYFTPIGQWEAVAGTNFTPGAVMTIIAIAILLVCRRSFAAYGLTFRRWRYFLNLALACSLALIAVAAIGLWITRFHFDPSRPPDPHAPPQLVRVVGGIILGLAGIAVVVLLVRVRSRVVEDVPPLISFLVLLGLLALPQLVAIHFGRPARWLTTLWLFFGAGFGEEIFYRGYVQSRIDQAFGCPFRLLGFNFGLGLLISSLLFGFLHVLNTVDYFRGHFDFGWWYGLQSLFLGLLYGCIRARSGSVLPGAIMHGLLDVMGRVPSLLPVSF